MNEKKGTKTELTLQHYWYCKSVKFGLNNMLNLMLSLLRVHLLVCLCACLCGMFPVPSHHLGLAVLIFLFSLHSLLPLLLQLRENAQPVVSPSLLVHIRLMGQGVDQPRLGPVELLTNYHWTLTGTITPYVPKKTVLCVQSRFCPFLHFSVHRPVLGAESLTRALHSSCMVHHRFLLINKSRIIQSLSYVFIHTFFLVCFY